MIHMKLNRRHEIREPTNFYFYFSISQLQEAWINVIDHTNDTIKSFVAMINYSAPANVTMSGNQMIFEVSNSIL